MFVKEKYCLKVRSNKTKPTKNAAAAHHNTTSGKICLFYLQKIYTKHDFQLRI